MSETLPPAAGSAAGAGESQGAPPCDSLGTYSTAPGSLVATSYARVWRPAPVVHAQAPVAEAPAPEAPAPVAEAPTPEAVATEAPAPAADAADAPASEAPAPVAETPTSVMVVPARLDEACLSPVVEVSGQGPLAQAEVAPAAEVGEAPLPTPTLVPNPATTRPSSRVRTLSRPTPMTRSGVIARPATSGTASGAGPVSKPVTTARSSGSGLVQSGTRRLSSSGVWPADDGWPAELERTSTAGQPLPSGDGDAPRARRPRRVRRWLASTALLCLAFTAVTTLAEGELERDLRRTARGPTHSPVLTVADAAPRPAPPAPSAPGPRQAKAEPSIPAPAPARQPDAPAARAVAAPQSDFVAMPGPRTSLARGALADLVRLRTLGARLATVDKLAAGDPAQAAEALAPLLDGELPGMDGYEVEQLRLKVMSAVGRLPGPVADRALLARLDPERPRTERLLALSLLSKRPEALSLGRVDLERMAASDADVVVKRAATRSLGALASASGGAAGGAR